jgi:hypothetical protein
MKVEGPAARRPFGGGWLTHRNGGLAKGTRFVAKGPPPGKGSERLRHGFFHGTAQIFSY